MINSDSSPSTRWSDHFSEVASLWDLERLYDDLGDILGRTLTDVEAAYLRGLLYYGSRTKVAKELSLDPAFLQQVLHQDLYPSIAKLTGNEDKPVTSAQIPIWLETAGYKLKGLWDVESIKKWLHRFRVKEALAAVMFTVITGITANIILDSWEIQKSNEDLVDTLKAEKDSRCFEDINPIPEGTFNHGGSTTWAELRAQIKKTGNFPLKLRYVHPTNDEGEANSSTGIQMLLNNRLDIAEASRPLKSAERGIAQNKGFELRQEPVGLDAVAIVVHQDNTVPGLTMDQIRDIYTGKIQNWQDVGGPNEVVVPYAHVAMQVGGWLRDLVKEKFASSVQYMRTTTEAVKQVNEELGAIYPASAALLVPQCSIRPLPILSDKTTTYVPPYKGPLTFGPNCRRELQEPSVFEDSYHSELIRDLSVIYRDYPEPNPEEEAGRVYTELLLSPEGQQLIAKAGYIPIRSQVSCQP